ncbi:MAG: AEC family transporter [Candidatus Heimdallarchaeaceae archaeon]
MALHYIAELAIRILIIYAGIAGGFLLQRWSQAEKAGKWLLFVGINILSPALLLVVFLDMDTGALTSLNWWFIVLVTTLGMSFSMILDWLMIRKKKKDLPCQTIGAEINTTGFMNALFFPFPIIIGIMSGDMLAEGLLAASLYLIVQTFYRNTIGVYLGLHFGSTEDRSIWKVIKSMLLFPPTIGMVVGLILRFSLGQLTIAHHFADFVTSNIAVLANPNQVSLGFFSIGDHLAVVIFQDISMVIMLALVGLSFKLPKRKEWKEVAIFRQSIARFGGGLLVVLILFFLPIPAGMIIAMTIQSLAPPAVANTAYAKYFSLDEVVTSRSIALLTLIALVVLPLEIVLLVLYMG